MELLLAEETEFRKRIAWLSFGRNSICLRNALLPLAIYGATLMMSGQYSHDNASEEMLSRYQLRSCSDLRLAITRGDNFEVFCSSLSLINSSLALVEDWDPTAITRLLVHFSGLWAVIKQLYVNSSVTTAQQILYEWKFMTILESARRNIAHYFSRRPPPNRTDLCLARIGQVVTSILSEVLNWPIPSASRVDGLDQIIRYRRLDLALYFSRLDPTSPGRRSLESDATLDILRSLTSIDMQIALGIDEFLRLLSGIDFPPPQLGFDLDWVFLCRVSKHLFYKVLDLSISSDDPITEVMNTCYQLIATFLNSDITGWDNKLKADILFFTGLYLTKSRDPTGKYSSSIKFTDLLLANEWIRSAFNDLSQHPAMVDSSLARSGWEEFFLPLWDLADRCCSPREVLCLEIESYGVWRWMMGSFWTDLVLFTEGIVW
jgi:hypothetical protein